MVSPALDLRWRAGAGAALLCELLYAALDDLEPLAIEDVPSVAHSAEGLPSRAQSAEGLPSGAQSAEEGLRVFFRSAAARDRAAAALRASFGEQLSAVVAADVEDEPWARRTQSELRAISVGGLTIAPPWDVAAPSAGTHIIVIDPSTGFGTGHHETTRLCLALLQDLELSGRRVLDVGTGSGVLALAAARLGAARVVGIDDDPDALRNAAENVELNGASTVRLVEADIAAFGGEPADVVTANLTAAVLLRNAEALAALIVPGGVLIASGFAPDEADAVVAAFGGSIARRVSEGDWAAVSLSLKSKIDQRNGDQADGIGPQRHRAE